MDCFITACPVVLALYGHFHWVADPRKIRAKVENCRKTRNKWEKDAYATTSARIDSAVVNLTEAVRENIRYRSLNGPA